MSKKNDTFKQTLKDIDDRIEYLNGQIELGKSLERLHENEDFKLVILEAYFETESKRLFELLIEPTTLTREQLDNVMDMTSALRNFKKFFKTVLINAHMAPDQIAEEEEYRKEVTAENSVSSKDENEE